MTGNQKEPHFPNKSNNHQYTSIQWSFKSGWTNLESKSI